MAPTPATRSDDIATTRRRDAARGPNERRSSVFVGAPAPCARSDAYIKLTFAPMAYIADDADDDADDSSTTHKTHIFCRRRDWREAVVEDERTKVDNIERQCSRAHAAQADARDSQRRTRVNMDGADHCMEFIW